MGHSGAKRSSQMASYMNGDFGGGPSKAGLPYQVGRSSAVSFAFRQTSQNLTVLKGRKYRLNKVLQLSITTLATKYNNAIVVYNDGTQFNDTTDIQAKLSGLSSPGDDNKILVLNEILEARTAKNTAQTAYDNA